ncbi:MAG: acetyltransferase [halophilic archaeon J07HX5]|jgi:Acetyltransferase (GNAT) family.|nr:MAG: acetyltransferase [halophilic archaeon J07HX5]
MQIRDATVTDTKQIRTLHRTAIEQLGGQAYTDTQVTAWARGCSSAQYAPAIEADGVVFLVADRGTDITAFGSVRLSPPEAYHASADAELTGLYVNPSTARSGVGTQVCTELERRAAGQGVETISLSASLNAVPFYTAQGYDRVQTHTHEFSPHVGTGVTGEIVEMRKEL